MVNEIFFLGLCLDFSKLFVCDFYIFIKMFVFKGLRVVERRIYFIYEF